MCLEALAILDSNVDMYSRVVATVLTWSPRPEAVPPLHPGSLPATIPDTALLPDLVSLQLADSVYASYMEFLDRPEALRSCTAVAPDGSLLVEMAMDFWLDGDGVLRRRWQHERARKGSARSLAAHTRRNERGCIVVPPTLRGGIMAVVHGQGHSGEGETLRRTREDFWWSGMAMDIRTYVKECGTCGVMKHKQTSDFVPIGTIDRPTEAGVVGVCDTLGPFVTSRRGNSYIFFTSITQRGGRSLSRSQTSRPKPYWTLCCE